MTRLVCDREALNLLTRVFVFSRALTGNVCQIRVAQEFQEVCQIRVAQEFQEITNKKHARVMDASLY